MLAWMRWHFSALSVVALSSETKSLPTLDSRSKRRLQRMRDPKPFAGLARPVVLILDRIATLALSTSTGGCPILRMDRRSSSSSMTARSKPFQDFIDPAVANQPSRASDLRIRKSWARKSPVQFHVDQSPESQPPGVTFFCMLESPPGAGGDTVISSVSFHVDTINSSYLS